MKLKMRLKVKSEDEAKDEAEVKIWKMRLRGYRSKILKMKFKRTLGGKTLEDVV